LTLTRVTDAGGSTDLYYDPRGNVVRETRSIDGIAHDVDTAYDLADNPIEIVYPSDRIVTYARDAQGRVTTVTTQEDATAPVVPVAANIAYLPFGAVASLDYGNGQSATFAYDQDYRLTTVDTTDGLTPVQDLTYAHDPAGNITAIADALDASRDQDFAYDAFTYDDDNRLVAADIAGQPAAAYTHNARGERVIKQAAGTTTHYLYDRAGNLIAETDGLGTATREYIHLAGLPLALVLPGPELHTVHPDHLGSPQKMTDATGAVTWDARFRPFGEPHAIAGSAANDQRFPGQLLDPETGLHYNYFREYDPTLGRYVESDPIGLAGGLNTYAYVGGNPLRWYDILGLTRLVLDVQQGILTVDPERPSTKPYNINVTSGVGSCTNKPVCESRKNRGPIPRGDYVIHADDIDNPNFLDDVWRNFFESPARGGGDWGDWRVRIYPLAHTQRYGRTGFYLHGGWFSGTAGCIDFGGGPFGNDDLLRDLESDPDRNIPLLVK